MMQGILSMLWATHWQLLLSWPLPPQPIIRNSPSYACEELILNPFDSEADATTFPLKRLELQVEHNNLDMNEINDILVNRDINHDIPTEAELFGESEDEA